MLQYPRHSFNLEFSVQGHKLDRDYSLTVHWIISTVTSSSAKKEKKNGFTMANHGAHDLIMLMQR